KSARTSHPEVRTFDTGVEQPERNGSRWDSRHSQTERRSPCCSLRRETDRPGDCRDPAGVQPAPDWRSSLWSTSARRALELRDASVTLYGFRLWTLGFRQPDDGTA